MFYSSREPKFQEPSNFQIIAVRITELYCEFTGRAKLYQGLGLPFARSGAADSFFFLIKSMFDNKEWWPGISTDVFLNMKSGFSYQFR